MVRWLAVRFIWLGVVSGAIVTLLGAFATALPYFELVNHFRLMLAVALLGLFSAAWIARASLALAAAGAVLAVNVLFALVPLAFAATGAPSRTIRVTTFNVWVGNRDPQAVVEFLRKNDADIVILEEVNPRLEAELLPPLRATYPHVTSCAKRNCGLVLLSKTAWISAGTSDRTAISPPLVWASFAGSGSPYTVTGLHLAFPFQPAWQAAQINWLARRLESASETQILVGDFNLTPFSWKLNQLAAKANLRRHATFGASWPAHRWFPFVLLDNLLASRNVRSVAVHFGAGDLGSDHRPVTFDIIVDKHSPAT